MYPTMDPVGGEPEVIGEQHWPTASNSTEELMGPPSLLDDSGGAPGMHSREHCALPGFMWLRACPRGTQPELLKEGPLTQ